MTHDAVSIVVDDIVTSNQAPACCGLVADARSGVETRFSRSAEFVCFDRLTVR